MVVDSNLLLLLFLGGFKPNRISSHKRLSAFTKEDFDLLVRFLNGFSRIVTTPNILTEVSNLSSGVPQGKRGIYFRWFTSRIQLLAEEYIPSGTAMANRWARFGLTDAAIAEIASSRYLVLTDDFPLSQSLQRAGIDAINFNNLRGMAWRKRL